ncbi:MAG: nucleotidyltransferase family protein [Clostridia bacterium]|nr:nucleotidyltransferase family protein [Clostridia bacterium]
MSDSLKSIFFTVLRSAVCGYKLTDAEREAVRGADAERLAKLAAVHDLSHLLAYGLDKNGLADAESKNEIFKSAFRCEQLNYELDSLCAALEKASIPFIPLKGSVIRKYYPEPWMRNSCDIDVLVHESDLQRAIGLLTDDLGYKEGGRWTHDVSLYSPSGVHVELHFDLVEDRYANEAHSVLSDIWSYTVPEDGAVYRLAMSDAAFYFYHIAHMAKHFENGGCGIRPFLDLWILENRIEHDRAERDALLEKGGLLKFTENCRKLSAYWFDCAEASGLTLQMAEYILRGGVYGSMENGYAAKQSKRGGRFGYVISRLFPPLSAMHPRFPVLKKCPLLLPVFWVYRVVIMISSGRMNRTAKELKLASSVSDDTASTAKEFIESIGL